MADNSIHLAGNLTRDPEVRATQTGKLSTTYTIAVSRKWDGGQETSFFDCVQWGEGGTNFSQSAKKGDRVIAIGRLAQRSWEGKDGKKNHKVEVIVDEAGPSTRWRTVALDASNISEAQAVARVQDEFF